MNEFYNTSVVFIYRCRGGRGNPMEVRKKCSRIIFAAPLWRAVDSLPVEWMEVTGCFLYVQETKTLLCKMK